MSNDLGALGTGAEPSLPSSSNKRKRTRIACIHCRSRKQKCDGRQPTCSSCLILDVACIYDSGPRKRGLPTGYVRSLELVWALVFAAVSNSQAVVMALLRETELAIDRSGKLVLAGKLACDSDTLRRLWTDSPVMAELERQLTRLEAGIDATTSASTNDQFVGLPQMKTTAFAPVMGYHGQVATPLASEQQDESRTSFGDILACRYEPAMSPRQGSSQLPPPPQNANHLLDIYFTYTHCWLPIAERHTVFEALYSTSEASANDGGNTCLLWAIMAFSSIQEGRSTRSYTQSESEPMGSDLSPYQIYSTARSLIPEERGTTGLGHANAALILSLYLLYEEDVSGSWNLIGQSVRMALSAQQCSESSHYASRQQRDRTLLGCFVMDTLISSRLGRPPQLRSADIRHVPILPETGPSEWEPWTPMNLQGVKTHSMQRVPSRAASTFNQYVALIRILNDIRWGPGPSFSEATYLASLQCWVDNLPRHCHIPAPLQDTQLGTQTVATPSLLNLHVALRGVLATLKLEYSCSSTDLDQALGGHAMEDLVAYNENMFGASVVSATQRCLRPANDDNSYKHRSQDANTDLFPGPESTSAAQRVPSPITTLSASHIQNSAADMRFALDRNDGVATSEPKIRHPHNLIQSHFQNFLIPDRGQIGELGDLDGIEWTSLSPDFMHNLGFAGQIPDLEHDTETS